MNQTPTPSIHQLLTVKQLMTALNATHNRVAHGLKTLGLTPVRVVGPVRLYDPAILPELQQRLAENASGLRGGRGCKKLV